MYTQGIELEAAVFCSDWCQGMDAPGGLEVNYQDHDDEEAEFEREELQRQNEVSSCFMLSIQSFSFCFGY